MLVVANNLYIIRLFIYLLGYICEEISPQIISGQANTILTAIIQGMRREELSNSVRLSACRALLNSLDFTKANFDTEQERHVIMQVFFMISHVLIFSLKYRSLRMESHKKSHLLYHK